MRCCCCCLAPPAPSWSAEAASASALRLTPLYLGVGFPWLPLIESRDKPKCPGKSQGTAYASHRSLGLLTPASARSTASYAHSWKVWQIVSWLSPHHLQAGPISGQRRLSYDRRARWCPHRRRARCTRSCRCRSASSGFTGGGPLPKEC